jgi:hypothetical protein
MPTINTPEEGRAVSALYDAWCEAESSLAPDAATERAALKVGWCAGRDWQAEQDNVLMEVATKLISDLGEAAQAALALLDGLPESELAAGHRNAAQNVRDVQRQLRLALGVES